MNTVLRAVKKLVGMLIVAGCISIVTSIPAHAETRYQTGISTSATLLWMNDKDLRQRLDDIKSLGIQWIRIDFNWPTVQPTNGGDFNWEKYDRVVKAIGDRDMGVLAVLGYTPRWAQDTACQEKTKNDRSAQRCPPKDAGDFARFAKAAAARYSDKAVRGWEIWNEPNLTAYWRTVQPDGQVYVDPARYATVANAAASEIRPRTDGVVITGGLSPMYEPKAAAGMRQSDFLTALLPKLDKRLFDGVGIHPYSWPLLPSRKAEFNAFYTVDNGRQNYNLRAIMHKAGWGDKEIWATEYGASTKGEQKNFTNKKRPDHVTEAMQERIITQGVEVWYAKPNVGPLFVHSDSDRWLQAHKNENGFGLRRKDGSEKPAYAAFKRASLKVKEQANNHLSNGSKPPVPPRGR